MLERFAEDHGSVKINNVKFCLNARETEVHEASRVPGALRSLKGTLMNRYNSLSETKIVLSLSFFSTSVCQYPLLAYNVNDTVVLHSVSIHLPVSEMRCESRWVMALSMRWLTQNRKVLLFLEINTMRGARSTCARSMTFLLSTLSILNLSNSQVFKPMRYGADCTGDVSRLKSSKRCFALLKRPRWPSHMNRKSESMLGNDFL